MKNKDETDGCNQIIIRCPNEMIFKLHHLKRELRRKWLFYQIKKDRKIWKTWWSCSVHIFVWKKKNDFLLKIALKMFHPRVYNRIVVPQFYLSFIWWFTSEMVNIYFRSTYFFFAPKSDQSICPLSDYNEPICGALCIGHLKIEMK